QADPIEVKVEFFKYRASGKLYRGNSLGSVARPVRGPANASLAIAPQRHVVAATWVNDPVRPLLIRLGVQGPRAFSHDPFSASLVTHQRCREDLGFGLRQGLASYGWSQNSG